MTTIQSNSLPAASIPPTAPKTKMSIEVGGKIFTFLKSTFDQPHIKDSLFSIYASNRWDQSEEIPYFECDAHAFKHIASYIRHGVVPKWKEVENPKVVLVVADYFSLSNFVEEFKNSKNEMKVSIEYGTAVVNLKVIPKINTKDLIEKFVEKYNRNLVNPLKKEEIQISLHKEQEKRCNLELGMRLKNQRIGNGVLYAYDVDAKDYESDWKMMGVRERVAAHLAKKSQSR